MRREYVLVDNEELKKITPKSGKAMEILAFVKQQQIDPIYLDTSYFTLPDKDADKAYQVLLKAPEDTGRVGIAQVTMHQREYTVFIRQRNHGITVHTMYFQNEIREVQGYGEKRKNLQIKPQEIKLAEQLIETLSEDFNPAKYRDTFQEPLHALLESKRKGKTFTERPAPRQAQVIDVKVLAGRICNRHGVEVRSEERRLEGVHVLAILLPARRKHIRRHAVQRTQLFGDNGAEARELHRRIVDVAGRRVVHCLRMIVAERANRSHQRQLIHSLCDGREKLGDLNSGDIG